MAGLIASGLISIAIISGLPGARTQAWNPSLSPAFPADVHGRTGLRDTPMSHERNGNDVAAVLRHRGIEKADIAGYSHGGDAAIWTAIQQSSH